MVLTRKNFYFSPIAEGVNLTPAKITNSLLVIDNVVTSVPASSLFKGTVRKNSDGSLSGFSILEFLSDKGEIEIDKIVRRFSFQTVSEENVLPSDFVLSKKTNSESMFDYDLSKQQQKELDAILSEAISKADEENNKKSAVIEPVFVPVKECELYVSDKNDLLRQGFKEYVFENYRLLKKGSKEILCLLEENKYSVQNKSGRNIEIDIEKGTFIF